jgi:hypothetical protein
MSGDIIRQLLAADPFEPFCLNLSSRSTVDITRPERTTVSADGSTLTIVGPDGQLWQAVSLRHVAAVTFPVAPAVRGPG